jgi:hypothetical protein
MRPGWAANSAISGSARSSSAEAGKAPRRKPIAYYVKAGYSFIPDKLGLVLTYDQSSPDWTTWAKLGYTSGGGNTTTEFGESYTTIGATVQYWVIPGSAILLEYNRGMWKVGDGELCKIDFNRVTLGWRTIF